MLSPLEPFSKIQVPPLLVNVKQPPTFQKAEVSQVKFHFTTVHTVYCAFIQGWSLLQESTLSKWLNAGDKAGKKKKVRECPSTQTSKQTLTNSTPQIGSEGRSPPGNSTGCIMSWQTMQRLLLKA